MQDFSIEILKNKHNNKNNYHFETIDDYSNPSVLIHGPKGLLGSYSLNNGATSSKTLFPIKIHSISPGNYNLKLNVFNPSDKDAEFTINFPFNVDVIKPNKLSPVKVMSYFSISAILLFAFFVTFKLTNTSRIKSILHSLRSPTALFTKDSKLLAE